MATRIVPLVAFTALLLCSQYAAAQSETTFSSTVTSPKTESSVTFTATEEQADSEASSAVYDFFKSRIDQALDGVHRQIGAALTRAGVTTQRYDELTSSLRASTVNALSGMEAVRTAYEKTLRGVYGLLLDNTAELRKTLEDGDTVIKNINTLRGAECEEASFSPPEAQPARLTGPAGSFSVTTGGCTLTRVPAPLQLDYVLTCTEPGVSYVAEAARYTSRFVSAAEATTEECKVERKYGVESETRIVLLDPAAFFQSGSEVSAASGLANDATAGSGFNKAAAWYKTMFPVQGQPGQRFNFMPAGVADTVAKALKQITVETKLEYKPFSLHTNFQDAAESISATLSKTMKVAQKLQKTHRDAAEHWMDPATYQDLQFGDNLKESLAGMNMSSLFDGIFAKKAALLLSKTPLGSQVGTGKAAAAAAAAIDQLTSAHPMRTLLAKARQGAGQPVALKLSGSLEDAVQAASGVWPEGLFDGSAVRAGSLMAALNKDPQVGAKLKQLADVLGAATAGLKGAGLGKAMSG